MRDLESGGNKMSIVTTNLKISQDKVQLRMAELCMNPYDLCSKAGILYAPLCAPDFKGDVSIIRMRPHMVISNIGEFFYCQIQGWFFPKFV